jgi:ATP synthase protein I
MEKPKPSLAEQVGVKERRRLRARRLGGNGVWFGVSLMGLIGWSISVPTLLGTALGLWLDEKHPGRHSWTLAMMVAGVSIGCLVAWHWLAEQTETLRSESDDDHEPPG